MGWIEGILVISGRGDLVHGHAHCTGSFCGRNLNEEENVKLVFDGLIFSFAL